MKETKPHKNRLDLAIDSNGIESIVIQVKTDKINMFFLHIYKPPNIHVNVLNNAMENMINRCMLETNFIVVIGDLNVNFMQNPHQLHDVCDSFDLKQIVKSPTCFKSLNNPSLLDIILTNCPKSITNSINLPIGISDFHNYISAATKIDCPSNEPKIIFYRSFKNFNNNSYLEDLKEAPFHVSQIFDDIDDQMWYHNTLLTAIVDRNAPRKQKTITFKQLPYMNDNLRKAINVKGALRRKYLTVNSQQNWMKYKKQRNLVNKLKRTSLQKYFHDKCNNSSDKGKHFWQIVKPFMTNNVKSDNQNIILYENGSLLNKPTEVCNTFNEYYVNITDDQSESMHVKQMSADQVIDHYKNHPSINLIKETVNNNEQFHFSPIEQTVTRKKLKQLKTNKSSGFDNISPKFLKLGADYLSYSLTPIINNSIHTSIYPDYTKRAEVTPLFKKSDRLAKENYRPLSVLTSTSKLFEGIIGDQLTKYIGDSLATDLSAYRKSYSCNNVLVKCVENWRKALDMKQHVGCILIDLSKAFDCLPHGLLIAKLHAYGASIETCELIMNYLKNRKQTVKLGNSRSEWLDLKTGVPQGSILGPLLFNIFINDFLFDLNRICDVYNYADDNSLAFSHHDPLVIKQTLETASKQAIKWFDENFMKANPSKFQVICLSRDNISLDITLGDEHVKSENIVKLLGINIDNKLNFHHHTSLVCKKAARQLNALQRLSKYLDFKSKLRIYESFIASNFVYCSIVYNSFNIGQDRKMEKLNERAIRLVCNDYINPYEELLKRTGKRMLYVTRKINLAEFVHKVLHNMSPPIESSFFRRKETPYEMRDNKKLVKPMYETVTFGKKSIAYQGPLVWNSLPMHVKALEEYPSFKSSLGKDVTISTCTCGNCMLCNRNNL